MFWECTPVLLKVGFCALCVSGYYVGFPRGTLFAHHLDCFTYHLACHNSYLEEHKLQSTSSVDPRHALMTYWGYKFESLSTISKPPSLVNSPLDPVLQQRKQEVVNTNVQYATVVRTRLGSNSIVLGAEVDCIQGRFCFWRREFIGFEVENDRCSDTKPEPPNNPLSKYIELKTSRIIYSARDEEKFEKYDRVLFGCAPRPYQCSKPLTSPGTSSSSSGPNLSSSAPPPSSAVSATMTVSSGTYKLLTRLIFREWCEENEGCG